MTAVSVIVAVRNAEAHLREALTDITRQSLADLEIIVVDDGSTDASARIIAEFAAADARIRVVPGPATGRAGAARNAGLDVAQGDYLAFLDADDRFAPTLLGKLYGKAVSERADVAVTRFRVFDDESTEPVTVDWGLRTDHLPARTPFSPDAVGDALFYAFGPVAWNKLFRADLIRSHGLRFQELPRSNDLFFSFAALAAAQRITYFDRALVDYRVGNPGSLQGNADQTPLAFAESLLALQEWLADAGLAERRGGALANEAVEVCLSALDKAPTWAAFCQIDAALRGGLLAKLGVLDRPTGFVTPDLATRLADYLAATPEQYVFARAARLDRQLRRSRAEARAAVRLVAGAPVPQPAAAPIAAGAPVPVATSGEAPDVSVIVPVHNTAPWLEQCLAGVRRQSGVRLEIICVDDGSTDAAPDLLAQAAAGDPRIRVITQANAGLSAARNAGLVAATGRYVCFLDSDDYWGPDALAQLVAAADARQAEVLMFDADTFAEPGVDAKTLARYRDGYYRRTRDYPEVSTGAELMNALKWAGEYRVQACLYLIRRDFLLSSGLSFRPGLPREDNLFTFELLLTAQRAGHLAVPLYTRRLRPGSLITASGRASAARGYYLTFVEMLRATAGRTFDERTGPGVGATAFKAYKQARAHFIRLEPEAGDALGGLDPQPDAQAVFRILQQAREDARRSRSLPPAPAVTPPARPTPPPAPAGPVRRLRRLGGRAWRRLRRIVRG